MKKLLIILCLVLLWSCKEEQKATETVEPLKTYTIAQMMDNEAVGGGSFSADNSKLLVHSNRSGIYNAYTIAVADGSMEALTASDSSSVFTTSYFPNDERILLSKDNNGDEIYQIYLRDTTGTITNLTPYEGARANFYGWSKDEKSFYFGSNKRNPQYTDVYKMDIETFTPSLIYQNDEGLDVGEISDDEQYFALVKPINTNDSDLFLYSVAEGEMKKVNETQSGNSPEDFSKDGKYLYYTTDDGGEFSYLKRYSIADGTSEKVLEKDWDIMGSYFTRSGKYRVTYINEDAKNAIEVFDTATQQNIELPQFDGGDITSVGFSKDDSMMRFYVGGSNTPSNLHTFNLGTAEQNKLTDVLNEEIVPEHLVKAEVIRFSSFDGTEIPSIYYKPHQASEENPVPALVWVHGGPGGQSRQNFSSLIQYMVNHGYAILAVNNRGSSGYGKTFYQMDDLNHGDKDLKDCVEGKNWLAQQPEID
ncbi:MAG: prolyl oligopeptidase family serine peptidase, partial [Bacteroidota bacterium]